MLATMATFTLPAYHSLRPSSVRPECIHYLPDEPEAALGKETFDDQREVKNTLRQLHHETCGFANELYGLLAKVLTEFNKG